MKLSEAFEVACEEEQARINFALERIFSMLFWKDYSEGYLITEEKWKLINLIDSFVYKEYEDGEGFYEFNNEEEVREFIDKIRGKIGFNKLP